MRFFELLQPATQMDLNVVHARFLERNRLVIIMRRTLQLQRRLLNALAAQVMDLHSRHEQRLKELRRLTIEDLGAFLNRQRPIVMEVLQREHHMLNLTFDSGSSSLRDAAEAGRRCLKTTLQLASSRVGLSRPERNAPKSSE